MNGEINDERQREGENTKNGSPSVNRGPFYDKVANRQGCELVSDNEALKVSLSFQFSQLAVMHATRWQSYKMRALFL